MIGLVISTHPQGVEEGHKLIWLMPTGVLKEKEYTITKHQAFNEI
jgi:hypothetical protein